MKKVFLVAVAALGFAFTAQAQDDAAGGQTDKGKWLIEANTGFGAAHPAATGIQFASSDGESTFNIGLEGGYFVMDDLAVKVGLGYNDAFESFSYKIGAKYYITGMIPVQVDYSGASSDLLGDLSFVGLQGGYAIFLGDNVSVEPGLRYNLSLEDGVEDILQLNIGFALHF
ncbi:hypothetical protein ACFQ1M_05390 [Sungkyunkwania multivorans]|uniref:Outer membrane protein beta-barrel domain-containing protein n=1 Tax=Sungkyunkwania multivorans TaxID=1173618 RepID=A0ABW3CV38_9FLAO